MVNYPLSLTFKLIAFNPQVRVSDATGQLLMYVKQKALALREEVHVFADEAQQRELFRIKANKVIDFSARYNLTATNGAPLGSVQRQGMRSLWKATYTVHDAGGQEIGTIHEENPLLKVVDAVLGEVPLLGMLVNPAYLVDVGGQTVLYMKKEPSFFERRFRIEQRGSVSESEEELLLGALVMMMLLERDRG